MDVGSGWRGGRLYVGLRGASGKADQAKRDGDTEKIPSVFHRSWLLYGVSKVGPAGVAFPKVEESPCLVAGMPKRSRPS